MEPNDVFSLVTDSTDLNNTAHNQGNHCIYANCRREKKRIALFNVTTMKFSDEEECPTSIHSLFQNTINEWFRMGSLLT